MFVWAETPLQAGDRLEIVCPGIPELCVVREVGPDGTLSLPTLDPLPAAVRTPVQVESSIRNALLADARPFPISVRFVGIARDEVSVGGATARALRLFAPRGMARDRLLWAAGATPDADLALLPAGSRVPPGTALFVPSVTVDRRVSVLGSVATPRSLAPDVGLTLGSALRAAGGLTPHADPNGIVVVHGGEEIPVALPADAAYRLGPGDVVRVGLIADRRYVSVRGLVARPGSVEYAPRMTARQAIEAAGGVLPTARSGTLVWQTGPKSFRLSVAFLLERRIPDPVLGPSDTLVVEAGRP